MQISSPAPLATPTGAPTQPMSATPTTAPAPTSGALSQMGTVTTLHLVVVALFALHVIVAVIYGVRQKAKRGAAEREEQARLDTHDVAPIAAPDPGGEQRAPGPLPAAADRTADLSVASSTPADAAPPREERAAPAAAVGSGPVPDEPSVSLTRIKGLGPKVQARLAELGVTRVDQLAALTDDEADALDAQLGAFRGRIARDRWVEQARFLAAGDVKGFEAVFGRL